jgi:hypothetical protein
MGVTDGAAGDAPATTDASDAPAADGPRTVMTFFITSTGSGAMGGNLGGIAGADAKCQMLGAAAGNGGRTWRAYLSTSASGGMPAVNARDRIGMGPWNNQAGTVIAANLVALHTPAMNMINAQNGLDERGQTVPANQHDILTGSTEEGMAFPEIPDRTCMNWTSNSMGTAWVGHYNRMGIAATAPQMSWVSSHATPNCTQAGIMQVGGAARLYCFAIN